MKKTAKALPAVSKDEVVKNFPKTENILVRTTVADKEAINSAAKSVHLTTTEFMVKSALMVAGKLAKS